MSISRLNQLLAGARDARIAVVGDYFLDKYMVTDPGLAEVSIETGLEARQVVEIRRSPGAAGTVTNNLAALGVGELRAIGVIGDDGEGYDLVKGLKSTGVDTRGLLRDAALFTPTYCKPMARRAAGEVEMERLDTKNRGLLPKTAEDGVINEIGCFLAECTEKSVTKTAVIVADQVQERNCGVVTDGVRKGLEMFADQYPDVIFYADSRVRIDEYRKLIIKPNSVEAAGVIGANKDDVDTMELAKAGRALAVRNGRDVYITLGPRGILVCSAETDTLVPTIPAEGPIDIVGAGDSASAGIVAALCMGATCAEAAFMGNLCASVTIRKLGTTGTASPDELRLALLKFA